MNNAIKNEFFLDFLTYLNLIKEHDLELTVTGNLKLKEIKRLGELFKKDIYHRDKDGNIMFRINSEEEVRYLMPIRQIASVMSLTYKRKGKIRLSKNGRKYLEITDVFQQYSDMVWWFCKRCTWQYSHYMRQDIDKGILDLMQEDQNIFWQYCLGKNGWIDFEKFCQFVKENIQNEYAGEWDNWGVENFVDDFEMLGLFEVGREIKEGGYRKEIVKFQVTDIGRDLVLDFSKEENNFDDSMNTETLLPQIKFRYIKRGGDIIVKDKKLKCYGCGKINIVMGSVRDADTADPKIYCEDCAINEYMGHYGFKNREIAAARRRRIFDIGYLFEEVFIDYYLKTGNQKNPKDIDNNILQFLIWNADNYYNDKIGKEEKIRLEQIADQKDIECELKRIVKKIDMSK